MGLALPRHDCPVGVREAQYRDKPTTLTEYLSMKPLLWNVDRDRDPPTMTVRLPGQPHRFVSIELEARGATGYEIDAAAVRELMATDPALLDVIAGPS